MRDIALPDIDPAKAETQFENILTRALISYYQARGSEIESGKPLDWPYRSIFHHNNSLRLLGDAVKARLSASPMPQPLADLALNSPDFGLQCRNLYDACLMPDILNMNVISMNYEEWDHHVGMKAKIEPNLQDLFGLNGGLDVVTSQLISNVPAANENIAFTFGTDFGRQLAANGGHGADHGTGNYSLLIGDAVSGGVYGELFPEREALPDSADGMGRTPFQIPGSDIKGLTSFERVLARGCDWVTPGTGSTVFPKSTVSRIEAGVDLTNIFSA